MNEWLLFNANSAIFQEQVNFKWDDDEVHFVLDQHTLLDFYSTRIDMSLHSDTLSRFNASLQFLLLWIKLTNSIFYRSNFYIVFFSICLPVHFQQIWPYKDFYKEEVIINLLTIIYFALCWMLKVGGHRSKNELPKYHKLYIWGL